jgi:hypothetical protein
MGTDQALLILEWVIALNLSILGVSMINRKNSKWLKYCLSSYSDFLSLVVSPETILPLFSHGVQLGKQGKQQTT